MSNYIKDYFHVAPLKSELLNLPFDFYRLRVPNTWETIAKLRNSIGASGRTRVMLPTKKYDLYPDAISITMYGYHRHYDIFITKLSRTRDHNRRKI